VSRITSGAPRTSEGLAPAAGWGDGWPTHRLFGLYLFVSGLALLFPGRPATWPLLALLHLCGGALALGIGPAGRLAEAARRKWPRVSRFVGDWYFLLLLPFLYSELAILNQAVHGGRYFDDVVLRWEEALFGGQPSRTLAAAAPHLLLSEALHSAYLSYYLIIYGPPLILYATRRFADYRRVIFALMLTFVVHYLFFIYFPVQGPRYLFPAPGGELASGPVYRLTHRVLEAGSSRGAAFPSSHVAVAVAQTLVTARILPRLFPLLAVLTIGLGLGAVYGGFHYATDAVVGLGMGALLVALAPTAARLLRPRASVAGGTAAAVPGERAFEG
jgi:membrane-associated phospholipid phosphatase